MGKAKINKVNQKSISFDESARKDFLTGFRKRKNERRQFARNKIAQEVRQEKLKDRQDKREADRSARGIRDDDVIAEEADGEYSDVADDDEQEVPNAELNAFLTGDTLTTTVVTPLLDDPAPPPPASAAGDAPKTSKTAQQKPKPKKFNLSVSITNAIPGYQLPSHMKGSKKKKKKLKSAVSKKDKASKRAQGKERRG